MAYQFLAHYTVRDAGTWQQYVALAIPTILSNGGKIVAATGPGLQEPVVVEGAPPHTVTVLLEFESRAAGERWYNSPEYQAVIGLRTGSTNGWVLGLPAFRPPAQ